MPSEELPESQDEARGEYRVGYRKPPRSTQFRKGQSGNPRGRRKTTKSFKTLLTAALDEKVAVTENGANRKISKREAAAKQLANRIAMGDLASLRLVVELLAEREERDDEASAVNETSSARERILTKLQELATRARVVHGGSTDQQP